MPDETIETTGAEAAEAVELAELAATTALEARAYLDAVTEVASGQMGSTALSVLLLAVSQVQVAGARLGAVADVVPARRFEPDAGPDPDVDPVRASLANVLNGLDDYADVADPLTDAGLVRGALSDDLASVAADLVHGLRHFERGEVSEALWWWQFSYLSSWGPRSTAALRVLQSVLGHLRLDVDAETASDAEFDALHP
ncbi:DUF5063 domain-containing protein [Paenibacillus sp. TRM 82003]|uniref:DUF5063 domain-containing protein n=1 Tax=Kineococcus sp. TRM81007 TaxID=2925831 RepID=UPI001F597876|nr:DUF5063 domain-containing protein [Kineococcus sp. TRM81007]MCI2239506.1 DUF5063 domain-containing protein [Kineococcus sp. TRM81007]MCI3926213.1 DUF5063 domain-containing protein [Paenibacillus sp. TRM 82003]